MTSINPNTPLTNTPLPDTRQDNSGGNTASQANSPAANTASSSVSISPQARELAASGSSGRQIMNERLFGGRETPVISATPVSMSSLARPGHAYLTSEDRALVADMYEYAQSQGADLKYVDEIAYALGAYRQFDNGKVKISFNSGDMYDSQGRQLTVSFDGEMAAVADNILNGTALNSTRFDKGFLNFQLDPGHGALTSAYDPAFLEQMVNHFSVEGDTQEPLNSRFAVYVPQKIESHYVMNASEEVRLEPWEPDIIRVNGEYFITEKGRANGITMEDIYGDNRSHNRLNEISNEGLLFFLEATFGQDETQRPFWVNAFLEKTGLDNNSNVRLLAWNS